MLRKKYKNIDKDLLLEKITKEIYGSISQGKDISDTLRKKFYEIIIKYKCLIKPSFNKMALKLSECFQESNYLPLKIKITSILSDKIIYDEYITETTSFGWHTEADISMYKLCQSDKLILENTSDKRFLNKQTHLPISRIGGVFIPNPNNLWVCVDVGGYWGNIELENNNIIKPNQIPIPPSRKPIYINKKKLIQSNYYIIEVLPDYLMLDKNLHKKKWKTVLTSGLELAKYKLKNKIDYKLISHIPSS